MSDCNKYYWDESYRNGNQIDNVNIYHTFKKNVILTNRIFIMIKLMTSGSFLTSFGNDSEVKTSKIVISNLYKVVPDWLSASGDNSFDSYYCFSVGTTDLVGFLVSDIFTGLAISMNSILSILVISVSVFLVIQYRIYLEEAVLCEEFGDKYRDYKKTTKKSFRLFIN